MSTVTLLEPAYAPTHLGQTIQSEPKDRYDGEDWHEEPYAF